MRTSQTHSERRPNAVSAGNFAPIAVEDDEVTRPIPVPARVRPSIGEYMFVRRNRT